VERNKFWKYVNKGPCSVERMKKNLPSFKRNETNFTISMYDPHTRGERYHASVLFLLAKDMSKKMWERLLKIQNRNLGNPLGISYNGEIICLDYLQAMHELDYMPNLDGKDVLEIGAGYGRTAHAIMSNYNVKSYTIADLENCLALSQKYLGDVLTVPQCNKITFFDIEERFLYEDYDFCLCIDTLSEIGEDNMVQYLKYIDAHCKWFYVKSPIGQYDISMGCIDGDIKLTVNECFDRVNVLDNTEVLGQVDKFVANFKPSPPWKCVKNSQAPPFMHYWQALYKK